MISIFDKSGMSIGQYVNTVPNACPYFEDVFTENILDGLTTLEFDVPLDRDESQWLEGLNRVGYADKDGDIRLFTIVDVYESYYRNEATKHVICEDVAITELNNCYTPPYTAINLEEALSHALELSGWSFNIDFNASLGQDEIIETKEYQTTMKAIQDIATRFDVAFKYTVEVNELGVTNKTIKVLGKYEQDDGKYFTYDRDLVGLERSIDYTNLRTAIMPIGVGEDGQPYTLLNYVPTAPVKGFTKELRWDFIVNDATHAIYDLPESYAYHIYKTNTADKDLLYLSACQELLKFSQPTYTYKMDVELLEGAQGYDGEGFSNFEGEEVRVGDIVWAKDRAGSQEIGVKARVVEMITSRTNPELDKLTFSNYVEISVADSADVEALRKLVEQVQKDLDNAKNEINTTNKEVEALRVAQEGIVTSLDGKSSISLGSKPNTNPREGDTWFKPSTDSQGGKAVEILTWNGTDWEPQFNTARVNDIQNSVDQAELSAKEALDKANEASSQALENSRNFGNLLQNFTRDSKFDRWIPQPTETVKPYVKITSQTFQGMPTACLSFMGTQAPTSTNAQVYSDWIEVDSAKAYEFSVYMKTPSVTGMTGQDYIRLLTLNSETKPAITDFGNSYVQSVSVATAAVADNQPAVDFIAENASSHTDWKLFRGVIMPTAFNNLDMKGRGQNVTSNVRFKPQNRWMRICFIANGSAGSKRDTHWANPIISEISSDATQYGSFIKQTVDGIQTTVNGKAEQSQVTQMAGQITSLVKTTDGHTSQITQLSTDINLKVSKGDVVNQINLSPDGILIAANKVQITGDTFIDKAVIKDANIAELSANKLTAGTIDAGIIRVINLDASQIKTGTLSAIDIIGTTLTNNYDFLVGDSLRMVGKTVMSKASITMNTDIYAGGAKNAVNNFRINPEAISNYTYRADGKTLQSYYVLTSSELNFKTPLSNIRYTDSGIIAINAKGTGSVNYSYGEEGLTLDPKGSIANGSLKLKGSTPFIDFHAPATNQVSVRIIATGSTAEALFGGELTMCASRHRFYDDTSRRGLAIENGHILKVSEGNNLWIRTLNGNVYIQNQKGEPAPVYASAFQQGSLSKYKTNIEDAEDGMLDVINSIKIKKYSRTNEIHYKRSLEYGMMVEDSDERLAESESINVYSMASITWKGVQELSEKVDILEEENALLTARLRRIEALLDL